MSSDSDDDYGNIAKRLQSIKSGYKEDNIKASNLLEDSLVTENINLSTEDDDLPIIKKLKEQYDLDDSKDVPLESIIGPHRGKRKTSERKSDEDDEYQPDESFRKPRRKSSKRIAAQVGKTANPRSQQPTSTLAVNSVSPGRGRGRGRSRGRGRGRRKSGASSRGNTRYIDHNATIYNIGNTFEYPDMSHNQDLFTQKSDQVVVIDDSINESLDENEELSVKVYWQSLEFFKFTIRRFQKFTEIYDFFAKKENVSKEKLLFTYNDKLVSIDDSPETINYNIGKFIDGGIVNQSLSPLKNKQRQEIKNGIKLKFQCQNVKKPFETAVQENEKLSITFMMCAEHFEKPIDKLKFYFDGDLISGKNTPQDLELEGGECIDVVITS